MCGTVDLLYSFTGTSEIEITLSDMSIYKQLMFGLWINDKEHTVFIATAIIPRSTFISGNRIVKIFSSNESTWGLVRSIGSNTKLVCNRTSATSDGMEIWGVR